MCTLLLFFVLEKSGHPDLKSNLRRLGTKNEMIHLKHLKNQKQMIEIYLLFRLKNILIQNHYFLNMPKNIYTLN